MQNIPRKEAFRGTSWDIGMTYFFLKRSFS